MEHFRRIPIDSTKVYMTLDGIKFNWTKDHAEIIKKRLLEIIAKPKIHNANNRLKDFDKEIRSSSDLSRSSSSNQTLRTSKQVTVQGPGYVDVRIVSSNDDQTDDGNEGKDFILNERFQKYVENLSSIGVHEDESKLLSLNKAFCDVSRDFIFIAQEYGKIIIREAKIRDENKSIKPINIGGILGGKKYLVQGVYFKFADVEGLEPFYAAKIAAHELKSLNLILNCYIPNLSLPLQCIIDYLGFRLVAMLYLPIDNSTMKSGSCDAGESVRINPDFDTFMEGIAKRLNLATHKYKGENIHLAIDVEGHVGKDGRKYLVDLSRVFPPTDMGQIKRYCNLFRPEFVMNYGIHLCSDGFSDFLDAECKTIENDKLEKAKETLFQKVISDKKYFIPCLDKISNNIINTKCKPGLDIIGRVLHQHGINFRYMGKLIPLVETEKARIYLELEITARSMKNLIREMMRKTIQNLLIPLETPFIEEITRILNIILNNEKDENFWDQLIQYRKRFNCAIEFDINKILRWNILLFERVCELLHIKIKNKKKLIDNHGKVIVLEPYMIKSMQPRIKHLKIISHAEGYILKKTKYSYKLAWARYEEALNTSPKDVVILRNVAFCAYKHYRNKMKEKERNCREKSEKFLEKMNGIKKYIDYIYELALFFGPHDTHTLYQYGKYLMKTNGDPLKAEDSLIKALEADATHVYVGGALKNLYTHFKLDTEKKNLEDFLKSLEVLLHANQIKSQPEPM